MSDIWTFSASSQQQLLRCIKSAKPPNENNKWLIRFGRRNIDSNFARDRSNLVEEITIDLSAPDVDNPLPAEEPDKVASSPENYEEILEVIEQEPVLKFQYLVEESMKNSNLLVKLARSLSLASIEKISRHIFDSIYKNSLFIQQFHELFIPELLKRELNWLSLDVVVRSHQVYPESFKILLNIIVKDTQISNKVLQDLVASFSEKEMTKLMSDISEIELTTEQFLHNIFSIYMIYKDCEKATHIQNYINSITSQNYHHCISDKNFGRLLLSFLQAQKQLKCHLDFVNMERIIESHRSPFKRPCAMVLNELKMINEMDATGVEVNIEE